MRVVGHVLQHVVLNDLTVTTGVRLMRMTYSEVL